MNLTRWIALRYLKSKKSHGAVSAIAIVSVAGVAIATAAVVCVLSVFNGFRGVLIDNFDTLAPDIVVTPEKGKVITSPDVKIAKLRKIDGVVSVLPVLTEKALAVFNGQELPVTIRGVDPDSLARVTQIRSMIMPGGRMPSAFYEELPGQELLESEEEIYYEDFEEEIADIPNYAETLPSIGASVRLGNLSNGDKFLLFAPRRSRHFNPIDPTASFVLDSVITTGVFQSKQREIDEDMIIVPIGLARHLFQYDDEATSLDITAAPGTDLVRLKSEVQKSLGPGFVVKDRIEAQEINFRMINIEKWVSFLLLAFILMIAGFNIISTMTMLVLEKRKQNSVISALGMRTGRIGAIYKHESLMVSIIGGIIGIALGVLLCWLQQEFGLVKLAGDPSKLLMKAYPVKIQWSDVGLAFIPCVVLGVLAAFIASSFARSRLSNLKSTE